MTSDKLNKIVLIHEQYDEYLSKSKFASQPHKFQTSPRII